MYLNDVWHTFYFNRTAYTNILFISSIHCISNCCVAIKLIKRNVELFHVLYLGFKMLTVLTQALKVFIKSFNRTFKVNMRSHLVLQRKKWQIWFRSKLDVELVFEMPDL